MSITFITGNSNKLKELQNILANKIKITSLKIDLPEIQGDPIDIAIEKAKYASNILNSNASSEYTRVLIEDTSLCFNALNGLPGPYIKSFEQKIGYDGLNNLLNAYTDKSAYALCIFVLIPYPNEKPLIFQGICNGQIVGPESKNNGFGWDIIFKPDNYDKTFAEMYPLTKNKISHRAIALNELKKYFEK